MNRGERTQKEDYENVTTCVEGKLKHKISQVICKENGHKRRNGWQGQKCWERK